MFTGYDVRSRRLETCPLIRTDVLFPKLKWNYKWNCMFIWKYKTKTPVWDNLYGSKILVAPFVHESSVSIYTKDFLHIFYYNSKLLSYPQLSLKDIMNKKVYKNTLHFNLNIVQQI